MHADQQCPMLNVFMANYWQEEAWFMGLKECATSSAMPYYCITRVHVISSYVTGNDIHGHLGYINQSISFTLEVRGSYIEVIHL